MKGQKRRAVPSLILATPSQHPRWTIRSRVRMSACRVSERAQSRTIPAATHAQEESPCCMKVTIAFWSKVKEHGFRLRLRLGKM